MSRPRVTKRLNPSQARVNGFGPPNESPLHPSRPTAGIPTSEWLPTYLHLEASFPPPRA
ncbi:hypothetical protein BO99DRAFT_407357 [Aspergillus violaceofuscus CBS 115571]|uniref:Uncharacterized protein n=1 Tax=Aspergillus violaceofuscus (strain CBS 115571) TaxID=1450538 RepID=A0A2V5GWM6_ASPV1|nr:hypothetical protein BO99DRAFT_407357 [Aspergillus violaceofuscus CBS 115571]